MQRSFLLEYFWSILAEAPQSMSWNLMRIFQNKCAASINICSGKNDFGIIFLEISGTSPVFTTSIDSCERCFLKKLGRLTHEIDIAFQSPRTQWETNKCSGLLRFEMCWSLQSRCIESQCMLTISRCQGAVKYMLFYKN